VQKISIQRIVAKLVLCGSYGVGKTSIRRNYMGETFIQDHLSTLGADFAVKRVDVKPQVVLELQIWDLAGQPGFESLRRRFFKGSAAALMVFDLTRESTFEDLDSWFEQLWSSQKSKDIPIAIIGNKIDLADAAHEEKVKNYIKNLKEEHGLENTYLSYYTTSAKTGENIQTVFAEISETLYHKLKDTV